MSDIRFTSDLLRRRLKYAHWLGDHHQMLTHQAQVQADRTRAAALKLRAEHPDHPDLDWLEGDHHD